jgi:hypothetical protein
MSSGGRSHLPEEARYTKYYEHDGMLRAYANRSMLLATLFGMLAMASLGFAIYVGIRPPTVIRVNKDGSAVELSGAGSAKSSGMPLSAHPWSVVPAASAAPSEVEGRAVVREFLNRYLAYTPESVDRNLAAALNMTTANLRLYMMSQLRDEDTVGKIRAQHIIANFEIRSIEHVPGTPWTYTAFGVKEIHRVRAQTETTDQIVAKYNVRLAETTRTETNPNGLLVAEYSEEQMVGDRQSGLRQHGEIDGAEK